MAEIQYTLADLIKFSSEQKPIEFGNAFNDLIASKIETAIDQKKIEVAQSMFNRSEIAQDYTPEQESEEQEDGQTS